ncbi:MAG: hypothetical protein ACE5LC_08780 [Candidatus Aminicenantales bacterium]
MHKLIGEPAINVVGRQYIPGLILGGGAEFTLSEKISIELDAEFRTVIHALYEISFPVLVKLKQLFHSSFYLLGGGDLSYIIWAGSSWRFDYGVVFGGGIELKKLTPISYIEIRCHIRSIAFTLALVLAFSL